LQANLATADWYERIIECAPVSMVLVDPAMQVVLANRSAEQLLGYGHGALVGQPLHALVPVRNRERHGMFASDFARASEARRMGEGRELFALHANGTEIPVEIGLNPLRSARGDYVLASIVDLRELRREQASQLRMAAVVESAEDAIITRSLDGIIQSWNPGAQRLLGYSPDEIIGRPVSLLIPPARGEDEALIIALLNQGKRVAQYETLRRRKDGSLVDVSLTVSPILDLSGRVIGAAKIMQDISRRKQAEQSLLLSNQQLLEANRALDDFVYTASHDLRAPLVGVNRLAQWVLEDDHALAPKSRDRLLVIQGRIARMARLLDDIRDYARAGQERRPPEAPVAAANVLQEVLSSLDVPAGFSVLGDASLQRVQVARIPLLQVLHNLVANAIKHHDRATGTISVTVLQTGRSLRFRVEDDGPGIPVEYRETVFEMFRTLRPRDEVEGSGMGLAMVRKLVGRMGGACGVEGPDGRGARIWFDWPRHGD
jgi:PAS domain S-box-containing protein